MTTLTLILPGDWPDPQREASWLLHDADGRLIDHGHGPASTWPTPGRRQANDAPASEEAAAAMPCTLLLAGSQLAIHAARLPAGTAGRQPAVLASLLEDRLLEDGERLLYAADAGGEQVAVIRRSRLSALLERLAELGLRVGSAWPLLFALPQQQGIQAVAIGKELDLRLPDGRGIALPLDAALADWLAALHDEGLPRPLPAWHPAAEEIAEPSLDHGQLSLSNEPPVLQPPNGSGFLYGSLAPASIPNLHPTPWQRPRRLALGFLLATGLLGLADIGRMAYLARDYRQQIAASFHRVLPGSAMLDPIRQLQRVLVPTEADPAGFHPLARGLLGDPELLRNMDSLHFQPGHLQLLTAARIEGKALDDHCRPLGLACTHRPEDGKKNDPVLTEIDISPLRQP